MVKLRRIDALNIFKLNVFKLSLEEAVANLYGVKQRTVLSLLGIVVGAASVTALINIGENASRESTRQYLSMGTNLLVIQNSGFTAGSGRLLDMHDIKPIKLLTQPPLPAAPLAISQVKVSMNAISLDTNIVGVTADLRDLAQLNLSRGRFIAALDDYETFAVLGSALAASLTKDNKPIQVGEKIRVDDYFFTIIGVLDNTLTSPLIMVDFNQAIFVPLKSMKRTLSSGGELSSIIIKAPENANLTEISAQLSNYISTQTGNSAIHVESAKQLIESLRKQSQLFTLLLAGIATISLIVGGIGIMNVMLAGLSERKKEIGLRMAIGATRRDILIMMLLESSVLSVAGGIIGALLGVLVAYFFAVMSAWMFYFSVLSFIVGLLMSILVGLFFGIYPAIQAAKMSPMNALNAD